MNITVFLIIVLISTYFILFKNDRKSKINSKIPGPFSRNIPIFGNVIQVIKTGSTLYNKWFKQYGCIYMVKLGNIDTVVLTGYPILKEAFIKNSDSFSNRYQHHSRFITSNWQSVMMSNGETHTILHKIILSKLTCTKIKKMESLFEKEQIKLISILDKHADDDKQFVINEHINIFIVNITFTLFFGFEIPDQDDSLILLKQVKKVGPLVRSRVISDYVSFLKPFYKNHDYIVEMKHFNKTCSYLADKYKDYSPPDNGKHHEHEEISIFKSLIKEIGNGIITKKQMMCSMVEFFITSIHTSGTPILYSLYSIMSNQEIQNKLYNNINSSIDNDDRELDSSPLVIQYSRYRPSIPYLSVMLKEVIRKMWVAPIGLTHVTTKDTIISGYKIAAGTQIVQNIYASHRDEKTYSQPNQFIPERFNDSNENTPTIDTIAFGIGVRKCMGQKFIDSLLFSTIATLINRYEFKDLVQTKENNFSNHQGPLLPKNIITIKKRK